MDQTSDTNRLVRNAVKQLQDWIEKNGGYNGYDPHDVKGAKIFLYFLRPKHNIFIKVIRKPFFYFIDYFPLLSRKVFGIHKTVNAKGIALFAKGYLNLFSLYGDEKYRIKALECFDWLMQNKAKGFANDAWGYPFDWQSGVYTPAGTPASVVTAAVGDAFWVAWKVLKEKKYLYTCISINKFFLNDLNIDRIDDETICFSYTPLDNFHVHNANLLVAEFLTRVGKEIGNDAFINKGLSAASYALKEQNADGSIFYWARDQNYYNPDTIDHYHSGFEIRCLYGIWKNTNDTAYQKAYTRYYEFYLQNLLLKEKDGQVFPKMLPHALYPVNIHSCAEAILLNSLLLADHAEPRGFIDSLMKSILHTMQNSDGSFSYMIRKIGRITYHDRTPYIRWGQAWMFLAMTEYLVHTENDDISKQIN